MTTTQLQFTSSGTLEAPQSHDCNTPPGMGGNVIQPGDVLDGVDLPPDVFLHVRPLDNSLPTNDGHRSRKVSLSWIGIDWKPITDVDVDHLESLATYGLLSVVDSHVQHPPAEYPGVARRTSTRNRPRFYDRLDAAATEYPIELRHPIEELSCSREYNRQETNAFLIHPFVDHKRGGTQYHIARFGARVKATNRLTALAVVENHSNPHTDDYLTAVLSRYGSHEYGFPDDREHGTNNSASWLISQALTWLKLEGYEVLYTYSGVTDNNGGIYKSLNFEFDKFVDINRSANAQQWTGRDGRTPIEYSRGKLKRWKYRLWDDSPAVKRRATGRAGTTLTNQYVPQTRSGGATTATDGGRSSARSQKPKRNEYHLVREDIREHGSSRSFDPRVRAFIESTSDLPAASILHENSRGSDRPTAVFGLDFEGELVAAVTVDGNPQTGIQTGTITSYIDAGTKYPQRTAQYLLPKIQTWSRLEGYQSLKLTPGVVSVHDEFTTPETILKAGSFSRSNGWRIRL